MKLWKKNEIWNFTIEIFHIKILYFWFDLIESIIRWLNHMKRKKNFLGKFFENIPAMYIIIRFIYYHHHHHHDSIINMVEYDSDDDLTHTQTYVAHRSSSSSSSLTYELLTFINNMKLIPIGIYHIISSYIIFSTWHSYTTTTTTKKYLRNRIFFFLLGL